MLDVASLFIKHCQMLFEGTRELYKISVLVQGGDEHVWNHVSSINILLMLHLLCRMAYDKLYLQLC